MPVVACLVELEQPRITERAESRANDQLPIYHTRFESKEQTFRDILQERPGASPEEVAQLAVCSVRTANKWIEKLGKEE